jgi:2-polyprenyl-6-hydroxyphenyl methylase/3-demethylubiquinone-9 3-methyltransferase
VSTLNRTPAAFALAIVGAEYIAGLLPKGTHSYAQFIRPAELAAWLRAAGLQLEDVSGLHYNPLTRRATLGRRTEVNYLACAMKPA